MLILVNKIGKTLEHFPIRKNKFWKTLRYLLPIFFHPFFSAHIASGKSFYPLGIYILKIRK